MSAKRRKETINRFCIPVRDDDFDTASPSPPPASRPKRSAKKKEEVIVLDGSDEESSVTEEDDDNDEFPDGKGVVAQAKSAKKGKRSLAQALSCTYGDKTNPKIMLISLKAGALGLNLTVANHVFLCVLSLMKDETCR
jgi:SWI/SNF-related matrix-associated actin-dependent regulator of chromatin subfamily A3